MQERGIQVPASPTMRDGFQSRSPRAEEKTRIYSYVVAMDGVRYKITLKKPLNKTNKQASLLNMQESDFSEVSRERRPVPTDMFISAYARFCNLADAEPSRTIEIYLSVASL